MSPPSLTSPSEQQRANGSAEVPGLWRDVRCFQLRGVVVSTPELGGTSQEAAQCPARGWASQAHGRTAGRTSGGRPHCPQARQSLPHWLPRMHLQLWSLRTPQCSPLQTGSTQTSVGDQEPHLGATACGRGVLHQIASQELREGTGPYTQHAARHPCRVFLFTQIHTHKHHSRKLACSVPPVPWIRS